MALGTAEGSKKKPYRAPTVRTVALVVPNLYGCSGSTPACCSDEDGVNQCLPSCGPGFFPSTGC